MAKIFLANTTKQHYRFYYTIPTKKQNFTVEIPSGGQSEIPHDLSGVGELDSLIEQIERFGGRDVREVTEHTPDYSGLAYFIDHPIPKDKIIAGHEAVIENAEVRSIEEVAKAAQSFDIINREGDSVREKMEGRRKAKTVEVKIKQEIAPGSPIPANLVDTTFTITNEAREGFKVER